MRALSCFIIRLVGRAIITFAFFDSAVEEKAGQDLDNRRTGDPQPDIKQSAGCPAHPPCHWNSNQEGSCDPLNHNKFRFSKSVEEADEAEQEAGQEAVNSICLQIIITCCDYVIVACKNAAQQLTMEKGKVEHDQTECSGDQNCNLQPLFRTFVSSCTVILSDISTHSLHKSRRNQHDEAANLFSDANSG